MGYMELPLGAAGQSTQRTRMTDAVAEWHGASYSADDVAAWNRLANLQAGSLSGFNRMVQEYINEDILGSTWERMSDGLSLSPSAINFDARVTKASAGNAPTVRWGTSPTNMPNSEVMLDLGGDLWRATVAPLSASTLYYFTMDVGASPTDWGRVGIYTQRTTA